MKSVFILLSSLLFFIATACSHTPESIDIHSGKSSLNINSINNMLLLGADLNIQERFTREFREEISVWSASTNQLINKELENLLVVNSKLSRLDMLDVESINKTKSYISLIKDVSKEIWIHSRGWNFWPHKMENFDYTIGDGLSSLKYKNSIDTMLFLDGFQTVKVRKKELNKESIYSYERDNIIFDTLFIQLMLIDITTGEILWVKFNEFENVDLRSPIEIRIILSETLKGFPGKVS